MMSSYRRNDRKSVRRLFLATTVVLFILVADLVLGGALRGVVRGAALSLWDTGARAFNAVVGSGLFSTRLALQREVNDLKEALALRERYDVELRVLQEEVRALRSLVHLAEVSQGITAPIISSVSSSLYGTFVIGAGTDDGIALGDVVLAGAPNDASGEGIVIGRVSEVTTHHSLVSELLASGAHIGVLVRGASFELEGRGGGNGRIEVPSAFAVEVGDPVFAPEVGGRPIGIVGAVEEGDSITHKDVFLRSAVPISSLRFVYVIAYGE